VAEPDLHPAVARPRALAVWDAWDDARRDEAEDAADHHPVRADAAEKSVGQELDVPARHASRRRSELQAAPAAEPDAPEPYKQVAAQSAERSYAALVAADLLVLPLQEARPERSPKPSEVLAQKEAQQAMSLHAPEARPLAKTRALTQLEVLLRVAK